MKKLLFTSALFFTSLTHSAIPINGWYATAFGGYAYLPNNIHVWHDGMLRSNAQYVDGYDAGANFGFKSTPLRYEGELTYINGTLQHFHVDGIKQTSVTGHHQASLAMANIYYDFHAIIPTLEPYLGIGIGYGYLDASFKSQGPFDITRYTPSNSVFGYQGAAGLNYNFAETWSFNLGYRYVATDRPNGFKKIYQANLANLGLVYRFDGRLYQ